VFARATPRRARATSPTGPHTELAVPRDRGRAQADIAFDADGFVTLYQDYLERIG